MGILEWFGDQIGGIALGMIIAGLWAWIKSKWLRRIFKQVFGVAKTFQLAFGSMVVHPDLVKMASASTSHKLAAYPLAKPEHPTMAFSAQKVASGCEIRAVSQLVSTLRKDGGVLPHVVTDDEISNDLDIDFISFGAMSNLKTKQILANEANHFAKYDETPPGYFVSKSDGIPLYSIKKDFDYGIILKIHPTQFPNRTWICCAGWGEWGTSGTAWFLANKWKQIAAKIPAGDQFLIVLEIEKKKDQSAKPLRWKYDNVTLEGD